MKKTKKVLAVLLAVVMMFGVMGVTTFASEEDPVVTVYFTRNNFSAGGYNFTTGNYIPSVYQGAQTTPSATTKFAEDLFMVQVHVNQVDTSVTKGYYNADYTGSKNALDVVIKALLDKGRTPYGGWDAYNGGGYLGGFLSDGSTDYLGSEEYEGPDGNWYYKYEGTNWQFAMNSENSNTLVESSSYATSITNLFDGMVIVFDLSYYEMYYPM